MTPHLSGLDVLFIAGYGPIPRSVSDSQAFYQQTLGLPLKAMEGNPDYLLAEHGAGAASPGGGTLVALPLVARAA